MVHALVKSHSLLIPGGRLVEVHDLPGTTYLELESLLERKAVCPMLDSSNFLPLRKADAAVAEVIKRGLYESTNYLRLDYQIFIDSRDSFQEWMSRQWETSFITKKSEETIHSHLSTSGERRVVVSRQAGINILATF